MKRTLALFLCFCMLFSLLPLARAEATGEAWAFRYGGETVIPDIAVWIYDAAAGMYTLSPEDYADYDPETGEPITAYTLPEEATDGYWVHRSVAPTEELFPGGGTYYAVIWIPDELGGYPQILVHPLTTQEMAGGLTISADMQASLAQVQVIVPKPDYTGQSISADPLFLAWQSQENDPAVIDLTPVFLEAEIWDYSSGSTTTTFAAYLTSGCVTAAGIGADQSSGAAIVEYQQRQALRNVTIDLSSPSAQGKSLFTAVPPSGAEVQDVNLTLSSGVSLSVPAESMYLQPGRYDLSVTLAAAGSIYGPYDLWVFTTAGADLTGSLSVSYGSLGDLAEFDRSVKVYADAARSTLLTAEPAAGTVVYADYEILDAGGNRLLGVGHIDRIDPTSFVEPEPRFARPTLSAGGSAVNLTCDYGESFAYFSFAAGQAGQEYTVTLAPELSAYSVSASDTFRLGSQSALADAVPNAPTNLAVTADRGANTAAFTWTAATHPNPNASITAYRLYRCDAQGTVSGTAVAESAGLSLSLSDLEAAAGEGEAWFTLRAFDGTHESEASNVVRVPAAEEGELDYAAAQGSTLSAAELLLTESNTGALAIDLLCTFPVTDPAASLSYTRPDGSTGTVSGAMAAAEGGYRAELTIPADAALITGVQAVYTPASGRQKTLAQETQLEVIAGAFTVTLEQCAENKNTVSTAALVNGGLRAEGLREEDILVSGDDLVLILRNVPRSLYRDGARLNLGTSLGSIGFPAAVTGDAMTIDREQVRDTFGLPYTIRLEVDGSAMNGAVYRLTADVDVYDGEGLLDSATFAGITADRDLTFNIQGSFTGFRITFRDPADGTYKLTYDDTLHADSFTCPVKVEPYTVDSGSVIPITMDGEPFSEQMALRLVREDLWERVALWHPGSAMADLSALEDGVYTVSPYRRTCVEYAPVTVTVQNGAIVGECPPLELYSLVYYSVAVKNVLQGSAEEYSASYDTWYRRNGAAEWVSCPSTASYDTSDYGAARLDPSYSGNLFIGPFRYVDVKDASGAVDIAELRIVPRGTLWRLYGETGGVEASFGETLVDLTENTQATVVNSHGELLAEPRVDVYLQTPLTFTGSAYPLHKVRVYSPTATEGQVQLNLFLFGVDRTGEPNGRTYARTFILEKFNEAAYQVIDDTAALYEPGSYWALYYTGPHDATKENTFLLSGAAVYGAQDRVFAVAYLGDGQVNEELVYLPEETAGDTFIATFSADSAQVTGSDIVGFLYAFTGDGTLSGKTLTFTPEGGWAAPAEETDLRASVTVDGAAAEAAVSLTDGKLTVTLPAVSAGQTLRGTVRLGYTAASVPADGQLTVSAKLGEETRYAYSRRISFTHDLPENTNTAAIAASGRGNWAGEKCFIAFYADGALCGAYELSKYGYWGGGFGEYRDIALPVGEKDTTGVFTLRAYRIAAASLGALPASAEDLGDPLGEQTVTYRRTARNILPSRYILRYINEITGNAEEISLTDPQQFKTRALSFTQEYETNTLELILDFAGDVTNDITDPQVVVHMGGYQYTFYSILERADSSGTRYAASWSAAYNGPMSVQYQQRPELYGDTHARPVPVYVNLASTTGELDMARLRAAYAKLQASPDKSGSVSGTQTFRNNEEDVELTLSVDLSAAVLEPGELQARLDALDTGDEHALVLDFRGTDSDLQYIYILPISAGPGDPDYVERNDGREYYRVGYTYVTVYRASAFEQIVTGGGGGAGLPSPVRSLLPGGNSLRLLNGGGEGGQQQSNGQMGVMLTNQFLGDINGPVGYFGTAKNYLEYTGANKGVLNDIPFQADNAFNERLGYLGDVGAAVGIVDRFVNDSDIYKEQQETIDKRIADINGLYAFAMAKCKCDSQARMRQIDLQAIRDMYILRLKQMSTEVDLEELACDMIGATKDITVTIAGKIEDPATQLAAFAVDKGVDAAIDGYRYGKNVERYDRQDDWVVKCANELDAVAATCNKDGCDVGELKRKAPRLVDPDPNQDFSGFGIAVGRYIPIEPKIIIDPSGIVYEGYLGNPLSGVECVIYESDNGTETGNFLEWVDAPGFDGQQSRQTTGISGYYEWYVPAGLWKVTYAKEGYLSAESQVMQVAPQWLDVHRNLLALDNTPVLTLSSREGKVYLSFSKPVVLADIRAGGLEVRIGGLPAEGTWEVLRGGEGDYYGQGVNSAATGRALLVSELAFTPMNAAVNGDSISVAPAGAGVHSYGGTLLGDQAVTAAVSGGLEPTILYELPETADSGREDTETAYIGPEGSSLSALDGAVLLVSEEDAVSTETKVTFTKAEDEAGEAMSPVYGVYFAVQPSDTVQLSFRLDEAALEAEEPLFLGMWVREADAGEWTYAGGTYDPETNTLTLLSRVNGEYKAMYSPVSFTDVPEDHWAKSYIDVLAARRIMEGYQGKADPDADITRAEVAAIAVRVLGFGSLLGRTPEVADNFLDVETTDWYYYAVNLAAKRGVFQGYEGYMRPKDLITREELAAVIARMAADAQALAEERVSAFVDRDAISDWAQTYVALLEEMGFVQGDELGQFNASAHATRAECAKLMYKLMELYGMLYYDENAVDPPCLTCPYSR